jgi:hypothetical protein
LKEQAGLAGKKVKHLQKGIDNEDRLTSGVRVAMSQYIFGASHIEAKAG